MYLPILLQLQEEFFFQSISRNHLVSDSSQINSDAMFEHQILVLVPNKVFDKIIMIEALVSILTFTNSRPLCTSVFRTAIFIRCASEKNLRLEDSDQC